MEVKFAQLFLSSSVLEESSDSNCDMIVDQACDIGVPIESVFANNSREDKFAAKRVGHGFSPSQASWSLLFVEHTVTQLAAPPAGKIEAQNDGTL